MPDEKDLTEKQIAEARGTSRCPLCSLPMLLLGDGEKIVFAKDKKELYCPKCPLSIRIGDWGKK